MMRAAKSTANHMAANDMQSAAAIGLLAASGLCCFGLAIFTIAKLASL